MLQNARPNDVVLVPTTKHAYHIERQLMEMGIEGVNVWVWSVESFQRLANKRRSFNVHLDHTTISKIYEDAILDTDRMLESLK